MVFGRSALARESRTLYANGRAVPLNDRAMDLLIALLDARGKILSIEHLQQQLWPSSQIDADSVRAVVSQVRRALGDDRDLIETVPRRGYRLVVDWYEAGDDHVAPDGRSDAPPATGSRLQADRHATCQGPEIDFNAAWRMPLIGRDAELSELLMRIPQHRLVTLMGARGTGKSRLAHEAALRIAALFRECVIVVDLADLTLHECVADAIAARLTRLPQHQAPGLDGLIARLSGRQAVLIIENFDHLAPEVATVLDALRTATQAHMIVCAEAPLFTPDEYLLPLAPLRCAARDAPDAAPSDACRLFSLQLQARGALPAGISDGVAMREAGGAPNDAASSVPALGIMESICRALGGMPLALELAADQIAGALKRGATPADALADWDATWRRKMLKRHGSGDVVPRRAELVQSVIAHAYYALDSDARHTLCCISLFASPFDLADASAVATTSDAGDASGQAAGDDAMRAHASRLVEAGLLIECPWGAPPYPSMEHDRKLSVPPAVRQFALARLADRPDAALASERHAQRVAEWVCRSGDDDGDDDGAGDARPPRATALVDVRRAVGWSIESGRCEIAARLLQHSAQIWIAARLVDERLHWIRRTLDRNGQCAVLKVRDQMELNLVLAQALLHGAPSRPPGDPIAAWWRVYDLATSCADDDNRLRALSVLLLRTLEAGFNGDPPDLLARVRSRIAQECDGSSTHDGFALLRGALLTLNGRHDDAIALLTPPEDDAPDTDASTADTAPPDAHQPHYVETISHGALAFSLWHTGANERSHPWLHRMLQDTQRPSDPLPRCGTKALACIVLLLEGDAPRAAHRARQLCATAQRAGLQGWWHAGRSFLSWIHAADDTRDEANQLIDQALCNLERGHATIIDLLVLEKFADLALARTGTSKLMQRFEQMIANLEDLGLQWLRPEALRVNAILSWHAGRPSADTMTLLDRAAREARQQHASMFAGRIAATAEQMAAGAAALTAAGISV
ncbi:winged helix-turn-helix domain-containing protein [Burkholderia sp. SCN-KJ]|uniref:winged helix-turn-helix domain-containing protein n=1 Tax=Burkholderia sp. SCN-KJ TaxID=2969248 RepID=UPI0021501A1E|nr:winged helix-turn-helix domain-containing protein [Burkholderia sp. SCN-KJ]MCR4468340.1 winged helix-turn-helix domain-containing protein [Burkholderia sp. SCN-KJ]